MQNVMGDSATDILRTNSKARCFTRHRWCDDCNRLQHLSVRPSVKFVHAPSKAVGRNETQLDRDSRVAFQVTVH